MKLNNLKLRNFKGIKNLTIDPGGENLNIYGDNGTGKTTVFDSFMWLLFDKDSNNSSNFNIKTLDENGEANSGPEYEVVGTIEKNEKAIELQKIYKERWTKRRGESEKTLTGHTTDYFINGVPKLKKEYVEFLESIIDEETFRILTNPLHFNTKLDWKKRRAIAMELVEEMDNEAVFKADEKLLDLKELLTEDLTVEDLKAKTQATKRKLNSEIKQIPIRIDELSRQDVGEEVDFAKLEAQQKKLQEQLKDIGDIKIDIEQINSLKQEVAMLETKKRVFERDKTALLNEDYKHKSKNLNEKQAKLNSLGNIEQKLISESRLLQSKADDKQEELNRLRKEYQEIQTLSFDADSNICKSCGQELQEEKKEENLNNFEILKANRIKGNIKNGKEAKDTMEKFIDESEGKLNELLKVGIEAEKLKEDAEKTNNETNKIEKKLESINFSEFEGYKELDNKIEGINKDIESILSNSEDKSQKHKDKVVGLEKQLDHTNVLLSKKEAIESNLKRVKELKEEERKLGEQIAKLEKTEMQCEQFIVAKASLLEEELNNKFKMVKFKLFNTLVNGGVDETFITTVDGVPFDDLNNAMKINAGLDIINTLTKHYKFNPPIFIDNRESINQIIDMESQIINLIVSEDKELKVENKKTEGVA